jgi:hypothetical protein
MLGQALLKQKQSPKTMTLRRVAWAVTQVRAAMRMLRRRCATPGLGPS